MTAASRLCFLHPQAGFAIRGKKFKDFQRMQSQMSDKFIGSSFHRQGAKDAKESQECFRMINDHETMAITGNVDLPNFFSVLRVLCAFAAKSLQRTAQFEY